MTKQRILFLVGVWIILLPFIGLPKTVKNVFFVMTGLGIILLSYFMYIQLKAIKERDQRGGSLIQEDEIAPLEEDISPVSEEIVEPVQNEEIISGENDERE